MPGWYPDPARAPGRFRYWDGSTWSQVTTANPSDAPPPATSGPAPRRYRNRLIMIMAVVVVLAIAAIFAVRAIVGDNTIVDGGPLPTATVSGGDDSSPSATPTPTPSSPSPSPTPTPTPNASTPPPMTSCPVGDPTARQDHPSDGRIHGGGLSFPKQQGWDPSALKTGLTWAYDVDGQDKTIEEQWFAMFAVGALSTADGFEAPQQAAEGVMECTATSEYYEGFQSRRDVFSRPVTVAGHPAWEIRSEIRVKSPKTTLPGDVVDVVVVDLDSPEALAMFWGAVPIGDQAMTSQLDTVVEPARRRLVLAARQLTGTASSAMTFIEARYGAPNVVAIATSPASRPRPISTRPLRRSLFLGSNVHQRSPR